MYALNCVWMLFRAFGCQKEAVSYQGPLCSHLNSTVQYSQFHWLLYWICSALLCERDPISTVVWNSYCRHNMIFKIRCLKIGFPKMFDLLIGQKMLREQITIDLAVFPKLLLDRCSVFVLHSVHSRILPWIQWQVGAVNDMKWYLYPDNKWYHWLT